MSAASHAKATIADLQRQVNQLTSTNTTKLTPEQLAQVRKDNPGIDSAYQQASSTADKNSPVYKQKGLDSADNYTQYWYDSMRNPKDYTVGKTSDVAPTPADAATTIKNNATSATDTLVNSYKDLATSVTGQIGKAGSDTTTLINNLTTQFTNSQTSLLQGFQDAQARQTAQMGDLMKQMQQAALGTGQAQKRPNYQASLDRSKALNSGGLGATMLTGPTGVTGGMTLGATSLLGGGK